MTFVFVSVFLLIGCYVTAATTSKYFDHGIERVLFSIQHAPGIKLTFQARAGSFNHHQQQHQTQMIVHGVVFPHTATDQEQDDDGLDFDGRLSYTHDGHLFKLKDVGSMTIQNVATRQVITSEYLEASTLTLPPIHDISKAMKTARVIEQVPSRQSISL